MIDTRAKRASCLGIALLFLRPGVQPDGTNLATVSERQHVQGFYAGLAPAPPTETTPGPYKFKETQIFPLGSVATAIFTPENTAIFVAQEVTEWDV